MHHVVSILLALGLMVALPAMAVALEKPGALEKLRKERDLEKARPGRAPVVKSKNGKSIEQQLKDRKKILEEEAKDRAKDKADADAILKKLHEQ